MTTLKHAIKADHMFDETRTEPELVFYDNMVSQMDTELIDLYEKSDEEIVGICKQVLQEVCTNNPEMRRYMNADILYPTVHTYTYDDYPAPFHAPADGYVISVCFAKAWSKNWGGEYITYHDTEPEDVLASYPGRIYVSKGTPWNKITQPNVKAKHPLVYLQFRIK